MCQVLFYLLYTQISFLSILDELGIIITILERKLRDRKGSLFKVA